MAATSGDSHSVFSCLCPFLSQLPYAVSHPFCSLFPVAQVGDLPGRPALSAPWAFPMCLLNDTSLALLYAPMKLCQLGFPEINQNLNHYTVPCITSVNELVWKASRWILPGLALETPETLRQFKGSGQREGPFVGSAFSWHRAWIMESHSGANNTKPRHWRKA